MNKRERIIANYNGHQGVSTMAHIRRIINDVYPTAYKELTGVQYGKLMSIVNKAYHEGRASMGAEVVDGVVYIGGNYYPLKLLERITYKEERIITYKPIGAIGTYHHPILGDIPHEMPYSDNYYYQLEDGTYERVFDHDKAEQLSATHQIYTREDNYIAIVEFDGKEIARLGCL